MQRVSPFWCALPASCRYQLRARTFAPLRHFQLRGRHVATWLSEVPKTPIELFAITGKNDSGICSTCSSMEETRLRRQGESRRSAPHRPTATRIA